MLAVVFGSRTRTNLRALLAVCLLILAGSCDTTRSGSERIAPNNNRSPAGKLREIVQTVRLEVRPGRWYPDGEGGASLILFAFAEKGKQLQNPGPLIRVQSGTIVRASVHNTLRDSLVVYGLHTRPGTEDDTIHVQPGATRDVSFEAGDPGTYFYWATTTHRSSERLHPAIHRSDDAYQPQATHSAENSKDAQHSHGRKQVGRLGWVRIASRQAS